MASPMKDPTCVLRGECYQPLQRTVIVRKQARSGLNEPESHQTVCHQSLAYNPHMARKSVQEGLRRRGNGRCGHSLLGPRGRRDLTLRARPHIMCMTRVGTTLPSLQPLPPLPCAECIEGSHILNHHLIQPLLILSRGPRANHHPPH
ncbi:hypothetical protein PIB30_101555 [Stylosanthes scabra]|uniref:Uncharacterized protein n=1 Tax=Stylosanthes scabra TaxID=79078 RepID=A0ABU6Z0F6_9FABA|nr:hypothetical protein [Stylosanthes scabra]